MTRVSALATEGLLGRLDGGFVQLYQGQTMLAQMRFASPAFEPGDDGAYRARPMMVGTGRADGVAEQWVAVTDDGVPILAGRVGDDMLMNQTYVAAGAEVRISSFTYRQETV